MPMKFCLFQHHQAGLVEKSSVRQAGYDGIELWLMTSMISSDAVKCARWNKRWLQHIV